jgi:hypothetical protein
MANYVEDYTYEFPPRVWMYRVMKSTVILNRRQPR